MKPAVALGIIFLMGCASSPNAGVTFESDSRAIASQGLKVFVDSWNRAAAGNMDGAQSYGTLYWPDAELVDPSGNIWSTSRDIVQMHVDLWNTAFKGSTVTGIVRRTRQLSPTLMIADFNLDLKVVGPLPPSIPNTNGIVKAHLKHVMERRGADWKVVAAQNTFDSGPPPAR
jgi:uncharacterized protein (TIGR02246 family)